MATVYRLMFRCIPAQKWLSLGKKISSKSSVGLFQLTSQGLPFFGTASCNHHFTFFCSQGTSEPSLGHIKKQAELGFKTGGDVYDANRPNYTDDSVSLIVSEIVSLSGASPVTGLKYDVLELGAGTGKLTEQLIKKLPMHIKYLASEPSENFLGVLKAKCLNVDVTIATADSIPLEDRSVGNVVCAQCFHWFSDKKNLDSIHRVLVPGGKLILIWNMKQFGHEWMSAFYKQREEVVKKIGGSMLDLVNSMEWRKDIDVSPDFKLLWHKSLSGVNFQGDVEAILANLTTVSAYNALPVAERDAYVDKLRQVLKNWPGLDLKNITIPFSTELFVYVAQ